MTLWRRRQNVSARVSFADQRGFALVLVIAILSVLALLAAAIAVETRSTALGARSRLEIIQARTLADSGVTIAIMRLLGRDEASRWQADGLVHEEPYGNSSIRITIEDEAGKIDLNNAPKELIAGLLGEFAGADPASALSNAIFERRASFAATPQGTGRFYTGGVISFQSLARLPFADVSELRLIPGMNAQLYEQLSPYVTVYSQSPMLNRQTASRVALLAIPNVTAGDVDALIASRGVADRVAPAQLSAFARYTRIGDLQAATIVAEARLRGGISFTREAVVAISPDRPLEAPRLLRWRQRIVSDAGAAQEHG